MPDPERPFNSLGQILSRGGEIYAARLSRGGIDDAAIAAKLEKKFGEMTDTLSRDILEFAKRGMAGGESVTQTPLHVPIDLARIPVNPYLFNSDSSKGRIFLAATVYGSPDSTGMDVNIIFPSSIEQSDILDKLYGVSVARLELYPDLAERLGVFQTVDTWSYNAWFAERQF